MKKITALISLINPVIKFTGRSGARPPLNPLPRTGGETIAPSPTCGGRLGRGLAAIDQLDRPGAGLLHPRVFTGRVNKPLMLAVLASAAMISLSGCNTVQGMGKDIERGGQAIEKAAR